MVCQYLEDEFELYLLGVTSAEGSSSVSEHLATGCPTCREHLHDAVLTVYLLSQPSKPGRLDSKAKASLLRRLRKE